MMRACRYRPAWAAGRRQNTTRLDGARGWPSFAILTYLIFIYRKQRAAFQRRLNQPFIAKSGESIIAPA